MPMKKNTIIILVIIIIVIIFVLRFGLGGSEDTWLCEDGAWVKHGVPTGPPPETDCDDQGGDSDSDEQAGDDQTIVDQDLSDLIQVDLPKNDQIISSPVMIKGQARGTWFFEGDFPVILLNQAGKIMAINNARAQTDWMTEDFVRFASVFEFPTPTSTLGTLILKKDNPSGLPEHDAEVRIPVEFKPIQ